jgi:hypothetical protein
MISDEIEGLLNDMKRDEVVFFLKNAMVGRVIDKIRRLIDAPKQHIFTYDLIQNEAPHSSPPSDVTDVSLYPEGCRHLVYRGSAELSDIRELNKDLSFIFCQMTLGPQTSRK